MSIGDVRDFVIVIWGAVSIILTIIMLALVSGIFWFGRKGMKAVHRAYREKVVTSVDRVAAIAIKVENHTATLPGAPGATGGIGAFIASLRGAKEQVDDAKPPFRSRRRVWLPFK